MKMLLGDRAKYLGLVFGIAFASLLMSQQVSIFVGIMSRATNQIRDIPQADIWVMDKDIQYMEETRPIRNVDLYKVRGVKGVEWAVPLYKGPAVVRTPNYMQQIMMLGLDDATLMGAPPKMLAGKWEDIKLPNAMVMDKMGWDFIWPNQPIEIGREIEINEKRVRIVGICEASPPFMNFPIVYTRYSEAINLAAQNRNQLTFVLVKAKEGQDVAILAKRIAEEANLQALTAHEFMWRNINYFLTKTGIAINFGITVMLGFIIGAVISGQTFYIFVIENLRQFGALKAIGVTNFQILKMVLLQAITAALLGYGIGIGLAAIFFDVTSTLPAMKGFMLHWEVALAVFIAVVVIILLSSLASIRKVMVLDPAIVFRG